MHGKSCAKINLYLKVFGKNSGFHMLDTALAFLDLSDDIEIKKSDEFKINISGEYCGFVDQKNNIFIDIAKYFRKEFSIDDNVKINLVKNIPVQGGLGGGSSNGAKLMRYFNEEYNLGLSFEKMQEISYQFGSDIAFFLQDKAAIIRNRGDVVCALRKFEPKDVILIIPNFGLSTKDVFTGVAGDYSAQSNVDEVKNKDFGALLDYGNDLFEIAANLKPELREIYDFAKSIDGVEYVNMSGSGSTMFAVTSAGSGADEICEKLQANFKNYKVLKNKILYNNE